MTTTAAVAVGTPAAPAPAPERRGAPRILVALDGSPAAAAALPRALALAAAQAAAVSVVRVVPAGGAVAGPGAGPLSALQAAATDLAAVAARLQAAGLPPQRLRLAVRVGRCPETALDQARREAADWLFLPPLTPGGQAVLTRPAPERA